jgi:hypothetical protein
VGTTAGTGPGGGRARQLVLLVVTLALFVAAGVIAWPKIRQRMLPYEQRLAEDAAAWIERATPTMRSDPRFAGIVLEFRPAKAEEGAAIVATGTTERPADMIALDTLLNSLNPNAPVELKPTLKKKSAEE